MKYRSSEEGIGNIISLNEEIMGLTGEKSAIEFPLRWVTVSRREDIADILLDEEHEKRKMKHEIVYLKRRTKTLQDEYVRQYDPAQEAQASSNSSGTLKGYRVFYTKEGDNGFLSDEWLVDIVIDGVQYSSALQAYMAMKAHALGKADVRSAMLFTRSVKVIRKKSLLLGESTEDWNKEREAVLLKIQEAKFSQHPELEKMLIETGDDKLIYANPLEKELGIGLAAEDPRLEDPRKWLGKNLLGEAIKKVRAKLRAAAGSEAAELGTPVERAISEAEQLARTKAIIARRTAVKRGGY